LVLDRRGAELAEAKKEKSLIRVQRDFFRYLTNSPEAAS